MNRAYNYVSVDSPNIPLICRSEDNSNTFGQFIPYSTQETVDLLGSVKTQDMFLPNFSVRAFEGTVPRDAVFSDHLGTGLDMLGSCIILKGQVKTYVPGRDTGIVSYNRSQNFKFDPDNEFRHHCLADTDLNFIHISFMPQFFNQLLPDNEPWAEKLKQRIERKERIVGEHFASISLEQERALANIFNTPLTGKLGYMMIETCLIQVILLQMYSLFYKNEPLKESFRNKRDLEVAHELKEHLDTSFLDDHTITALAQHFGTNTNKLMNVFKKVFGKSIFEYITEQRMEYARKLLSEEGLLVSEVARHIGYKNPNHFSTAFKKQFGVNPSVYR